MTRLQFIAKAQEIAARHNWTLDLQEDTSGIEAWFSDPKDGERDTAQAYMTFGAPPVGLDL